MKVAKISTIYTKMITGVGIGLTIFSLVLNMVMPEIVDAKTQEVIARVFSTNPLETAEDVLFDEDVLSFPQAESREARYTLWTVATAYSSDPFQTDSSPCIPADGTDLCKLAQEGVVDAIATNILPLGTYVRFPELFGDKMFVVRDRMNQKYNGKRRIDFYIAVLDAEGNVDTKLSKASAIHFGVKSLKMEVL